MASNTPASNENAFFTSLYEHAAESWFADEFDECFEQVPPSRSISLLNYGPRLTHLAGLQHSCSAILVFLSSTAQAATSFSPTRRSIQCMRDLGLSRH